jgi:hypothetical protein
MGMTAWRAEVRRFGRGGVELVTARGDEEVARVWFPSATAALGDARGRQFSWQAWGAIGSPTIYRGELAPWSPFGDAP